MTNKIIRTICYFQKDPNDDVFQKVDDLEKLLKEKGFEVQTKRLCSSNVEKNIYLSLHSGVGIDTYPIGIDEKPLSARFVSDGKAKIGEETDFKNKYLKDVLIKPLQTF